MSANWKVARPARICAATGRELAEGETIYSALRDAEEGLARTDYAADAWPEVDRTGVVGFWRTRVPSPEARNRRLVIDVEAFYTVFSQIPEEEERRLRQLFRYVLALILVRKRVLRLEEIEKAPGAEILHLHDNRAKQPVRVVSPEATPEEIQQVQEQLNQIFECEITDEDL